MDIHRTILLACLLGTCAMAEEHNPLAVVVNSDNKVEKISKPELIHLYMGRTNQFPNGNSVLRLDQEAGSSERERFYRKLVDKSPAEINAYWARLRFTGRAKPPTEVPDNNAVIDVVQEDPNAIGYIAEEQADERVRILNRVE